MERVKTIPTNLGLISETVSIPARGRLNAARFQVVVEFATGVCFVTAVAESPKEAVEVFMLQSPGCEEGEVSLFDRNEQRIVASVKWKMSGTEIGLRIPHRQNVFHDWHLALIACQIQKQKQLVAAVELIA